MIQRFKSPEAARLLAIDEHMLKPLREHGFLIGTKSGKGYLYDSEELEHFIRMTRGYDLSNESKIRIAAQIIQPQKRPPGTGFGTAR